MPATSLEREVKLRFDSADDARAAVLAAGCTTAARPPAPGRRAARYRRRAAAAAPLRPPRPRGKRQEPDHVQGAGPALADEAARRARDAGRRRRGAAQDLRGARLPRLVPLREVPRGVLARGRDRRDRRDAGRRLRRDRGQRAGDRGHGRGARPLAAPTTSSIRTAACSCSTARPRADDLRHGVRGPKQRS